MRLFCRLQLDFFYNYFFFRLILMMGFQKLFDRAHFVGFLISLAALEVLPPKSSWCQAGYGKGPGQRVLGAGRRLGRIFSHNCICYP